MKKVRCGDVAAIDAFADKNIIIVLLKGGCIVADTSTQLGRLLLTQLEEEAEELTDDMRLTLFTREGKSVVWNPAADAGRPTEESLEMPARADLPAIDPAPELSPASPAPTPDIGATPAAQDIAEQEE